MSKDIKYTINSGTIATAVCRGILLSAPSPKRFQNSFNKYCYPGVGTYI